MVELQGYHVCYSQTTPYFSVKTNVKSYRELKVILAKYERASGQQINGLKSSISFSRKASAILRQRVKLSLEIEKEGGGVSKYLGLPQHFK